MHYYEIVKMQITYFINKLILAIVLFVSISSLERPLQAAARLRGSPLKNPALTCSVLLFEDILMRNGFKTIRGLPEYVGYLHPDFLFVLASLRFPQVWLDIGAGRAFAQRDYRTAKSSIFFTWDDDPQKEVFLPELSDKAKLISIAIRKPIEATADLNALQLQGQLDYVEDTIQNYALAHPHSVDLATDEHASTLYSKVDTAIWAIATVLKVGGHGFFSLNHSKFLSKNGKSLTPEAYLKLCKGFSYDRSKVGEGRGHGERYAISPNGEPIFVPELKVIETNLEQDSDGPLVTYQIK